MLRQLETLLSAVRPYAAGALSKGSSVGRFAFGGPTGLAFSLLPSYMRSIPSDTPASLASRHAHEQARRDAIMGAVDALPGQNKFDNAFSAFNPSQYNMLADPMAEYIKKQNEAAGVPSPQPTSSVNAQASVPPASAASPTASTPLPQPRPLTAGDNTYTFGGVQVPVFGQPTPSPFSGAGFGAGDAFGSPANMGQGATIDNSALMKAILGMF